MGRGEIIEHVGYGLYKTRLSYDNRRVNSTLALMQNRIDALGEYIAGLEDGEEKTIAQLKKTAIEKRMASLQLAVPDDPEVYAWCADDFYDLDPGTVVGTMEVPGGRQAVQIRPAHDGGAAHDHARDGQLQHALGGTAASVFYNLAMMPGWQRWRPMYRVGTIVNDSINYDADTCDVCLDPANSSHQNINVNADAGFGGCDAAAPAGFFAWSEENPDHPLATNTSDPGPIDLTPELYEQIVSVQQSVNAAHDQLTDPAVGDIWRIMEEGESGDCEDFALTKAQALLDAGWDAGLLRIAYCETELGTGHAVLMIDTVSHGTLVLDNRYPLPMRQERLPYRFMSRQKAGATWEAYSPRLTAVPIQYGRCNAEAFAAGDRVVIAFDDRDWSSPKVVGFETLPDDGFEFLYMATKRHPFLDGYEGDGNIYRRSENREWVLWGQIGGLPEVDDIIRFGGYFYAFACRTSPDVGAIYRSADGASWDSVKNFDEFYMPVGGDWVYKPVSRGGRLVAVDETLYAAVSKAKVVDDGEDTWGHWWTEIWKSSNGTNWSLFWQCDLGYESDDHSGPNNSLGDMVGLNGNLYITVGWAPAGERGGPYPLNDRVFKISAGGSVQDITFGGDEYFGSMGDNAYGMFAYNYHIASDLSGQYNNIVERIYSAGISGTHGSIWDVYESGEWWAVVPSSILSIGFLSCMAAQDVRWKDPEDEYNVFVQSRVFLFSGFDSWVWALDKYKLDDLYFSDFRPSAAIANNKTVLIAGTEFDQSIFVWRYHPYGLLSEPVQIDDRGIPMKIIESAS